MEANLNAELQEEKSKLQTKYRKLENNPDIKLLGAHDSQADVKVLRSLGLDRNIRKVENVRSKKIQLEDYEGKFEGMIFTVEMLQNLAVNYRLKLLNPQFYKGQIDPLTAPRLREFMDNNKISYETSGYADQFFILAPKEDFSNNFNEEAKSTKSAMAFYRVDSGHYRLIHKWGNNFSLWRYVIAWRFRNATTYLVHTFMILTFVLLTLIGFCFPQSSDMSWLIWSFLLSGGISWMFYLASNYKDNKKDSFLTIDNWKRVK